MDRALEDRVAGMAQLGVPFEEIEDELEAEHDLSEEEKSALWLIAWSYQTAQSQRLIARQALAHDHVEDGHSPSI